MISRLVITIGSGREGFIEVSMYCIKCGKKNQPEYTFCYNCGAPLVKPDSPPPPDQPSPAPPPSNGGRPPFPYGNPPLPRRGEVQRFPVASNGKPFVVVDHPDAFVSYKNQDGKQVYAAFATIQARFLAVTVDTIFYQLIQFLVGAIVLAINPGLIQTATLNGALDQRQLTYLPPWVSFLGITLYLLYCIVSTWRFGGQTIGKRVVKIKVIRKDGGRPDFQTALRRNIFGYSLGLGVLFVNYGTFGAVLGLLLILMVAFGFSAAFVSRQRQGWHDLLADTLVVGQRELIEGVNY